MQKEHRVAIVLDESFGKRLLLLAQRLHVWAVESPADAEAANTFLKMDVSPPSEPLESGITTFKAQGRSRCETLATVLEDVDNTTANMHTRRRGRYWRSTASMRPMPTE